MFADGSPTVLVEGNVLVILLLGSLYSKEPSSANIQSSKDSLFEIIIF